VVHVRGSGARRISESGRLSDASPVGYVDTAFNGGGVSTDTGWPEKSKARSEVGGVSRWGQRLRTYVVSHGIQVMCGSSGDVTAAAATDIPLLSGAARLGWLKLLHTVGVTKFVATSGLGYEFVCHTGDLANFPFYHRRAYAAELELCAAWLEEEEHPVMYDIGANAGFVSTHLAQMLAARAPNIYAFEPVPATFAKLTDSVQRLGLAAAVHPVAAAVVDSAGPLHLSYSEKNSLLAQVNSRGLNARVGDKVARAEGVTLDAFCASVNALPQLLKIDVEGSEAAVLRGARGMLSRPDRPAILFEHNPVTLTEAGASLGGLVDLLSGYALHYVDDLRGQQIPFGDPADPAKIDWTCNLFAVPRAEASAARWASVLARLRHRQAPPARL
jgi:FkbM family methyltransferase